MSKLKKFPGICADVFCVLLYMLLGAMIGFVASAIAFDAKLEKEGRYNSMELQHELMIEQNETFKYCPYCGEELEGIESD